MTKRQALQQVRNIGIAAHIDAGKTTLTERILFYTGALYKIGEVHDGAAHMDYMAEEQSHGITITSAVTKANWNDHLIQIVDTPGHVDFTIEVERSMRVLDGAIVVLDGVRGVEPQTETVWRQRTRFNLPALFFVNKMDRPGADFDKALASIRKRLNVNPVPLTIPLPDSGAVIHLIDRAVVDFAGEHGEAVEVRECSAEEWEATARYRELLLLGIAEADESLADMILEGEEPEPELLWNALRKATLAGILFPCLVGSALRNSGVQPLLDAVVRLLPSPLDRPDATGFDLEGGEVKIPMTDEGPLTALAFKVQMWEGRRHVFARIYQGVLRPGDTVAFVGREGKLIREQVARLFEVDAGRKQRLDEGHAGDIVLLAGLRRASTGDTLCDAGRPLLLERIETREPVLSLAIEPASSAQEEKFLDVLEKFQEEDPTLRFREDPETGQRLLSGMGELHLQIVIERLEREFNLEVNAGKPSVALRETVTRPAKADVLFSPSLDPKGKGEGLKARVVVSVASLARGAGIDTSLSPEILPAGSQLTGVQRDAVEQGVRFALGSGPLEGAPLQDLAVDVGQVELFGGASSAEALTAATSRAVRKAIADAGPVLLRPIMSTEVIIPDENLGMVLGDLQARRATIHETTHSLGSATIHCELPLEKLLGYTTDLRSMTQGRGQFTTLFSRFDAE